ncbi:hypothetical protein K470DRAFT_209135 [Piedraia hortae CBS 480.64]|uniref:CCR4-Not complex 3'-5'-exoribonuclease subunit Ccr4 n=1 Tax=Piedraia hortae CBS 480.64 TaxID=1314780 RepID=A0A6A7C9L4_9PEZI|nr:hypothetical protein K470DRAFT_209135 [Piedraia hortae CBS 480.64]
MYNQRTGHGLLNGQHGSQMGLHKMGQTFGAPHINGQHTDTALGPYGSHQHSSSGGILAASAPGFSASHMQNGVMDLPTDAASIAPNDFWGFQQLEWRKYKYGENKAHFRLRHSKGHNTGTSRDEETSAAEDDWEGLDMGGVGLRNLGHELFTFYPGLPKLFLYHNLLDSIPHTIGLMRNLVELDLSCNHLQTIPPEIGMLTNLRQLQLFSNQLRDLPYELGSLYQLEFLGILGNPMRKDLVERFMDGGTQGLIRHLRETAPPPPPPLDRQWIDLATDEDDEAEKFSVLSWNTLCERAASSQAYAYTPSGALEWEHRRKLISDELRERDADILTLQEMDQESYEWFKPSLEREGYKGYFVAKARAQTMAAKEAKTVDGCATFYKASKFVLLDKQALVFSHEAINRPDMKGEHDVYNRVMPKDHIAVVMFLENRQTGSRLVVANTHFAWEGDLADVKIVQAAVLVEYLNKLTKTYVSWPAYKDKEAVGEETPAPSQRYDKPTQIPLLICGDFNSTANSGVLELITKGHIAPSHSELEGKSYGDLTKHGASHPFTLKSAYSHISDWPYTNYTPGFHDVIDYIWYSSNTIQVTGLLGEVDPEYLSRVPGFPNWHFPSDHLALWATFAIKARKEK